MITDQLKIARFLEGDHLTEPTSKVLMERLLDEPATPCFFEEENYQLLGLVCQVLMGEDSAQKNNKIASAIDNRLYLNQSDGWRYNEMPPDREMYLKGLSGIEETSLLVFHKPFIDLNSSEQTEILTSVQKGNAEGEHWRSLSAALFFEELLAECTEIYYSFPDIQLKMGYGGMADKAGWTNIKLNETEDVEKYIKEEFQTKID